MYLSIMGNYVRGREVAQQLGCMSSSYLTLTPMFLPSTDSYKLEILQSLWKLPIAKVSGEIPGNAGSMQHCVLCPLTWNSLPSWSGVTKEAPGL